MIEPHEMEYRGMNIMHVGPIHGSLEAEFIRCSVAHSSPHTTTSHPHAEPIGVVISARRILSFAEGHPSEFTAPHDQRGIEQATLLQVRQQGSDRLVDLGRMLAMIFLDADMSIPGVVQVPTAGIKLHESNSTFHQATRNNTVSTKLIRRFFPNAIRIEGMRRFLCQVNGFRRRCLHSIGQFIGVDPSRQVRSTGPLLEMFLIKLGQQVKLLALSTPVHVRRTLQIENRVTRRAKKGSLVGGGHEPT